MNSGHMGQCYCVIKCDVFRAFHPIVYIPLYTQEHTRTKREIHSGSKNLKNTLVRALVSLVALGRIVA